MPHPLADFYRSKRVFVSGHTSFAGGWLAAWLKLLGAQVCGYGPPPSARPNFFDATLLDRGLTSIFGDLRNREALANTFADFQPEIVIHYAAQVSALRAKSDPVDAFASGVMGTVHILEEARQIDSVRAVVIANSDENSLDFLGSTAACTELAASAYIGEFFHGCKTAVATARAGNLIGGGDWAEGELVPEIVRGIIDEKRIVLKNFSAAAWQHVLEPLRAHLLLAQKLFERGQDFSGAWNFAPQDKAAMTAQTLAEKFGETWSAGNSIPAAIELSTVEPVFFPNDDKAETKLGWKPSLPLDRAIAWTVEWYQAFYADPASSWRTTEEQIQRYMSLACKVPGG